MMVGGWFDVNAERPPGVEGVKMILINVESNNVVDSLGQNSLYRRIKSEMLATFLPGTVRRLGV
jgi:hypothetical protein